MAAIHETFLYGSICPETWATKRIRLQEAVDPIVRGRAPYTGTYIPYENLNSLNGKNSYGTWKLEIVDTSDYSGGTLLNWKLFLKTGTAPPGEKVFSRLKKNIYI